jgi:hypothetical protein
MNYYTVTVILNGGHAITHSFLSEVAARDLTNTYSLLTPELPVTCREMTETEIVNG